MRLRPAPSAGVITIIAVAVFALGASAAWLFLSPSVPSSLAQPEEVGSSPVTYREFTDDRVVPLAVTRDPDTHIQSPIEGRVTKVGCSADGKIASGKSVLSVNGRPLIALATSTPLWRPLATGDRGADVRALQRELRRLSGGVSVTGIVDTRTVAATARLFKAAGDSGLLGARIPVDRLLWIPQRTNPVRSCGIGLGESVAVGTTIATLPGALTSVAVSSVTASLIPGPRTLTVGSATVDVDTALKVTDPVALEKLRPYVGTSVVSASDGSESEDSVSADTRAVNGQLSLRKSTKVAAVPPAAVYDIDGDTGCVWSSGKAYAAQIVGSELGRTYLRIIGQHPPTAVSIASKPHSSCR